MPKAILEFNLPEERSEFATACAAAQMSIILSDLDNELRSHIKYDKYPEWNTETVSAIRQLLCDMVHNAGVAEVVGG